MGLFNRTPKDIQDATAEVLFAEVTEWAADQAGEPVQEHDVTVLLTRPDGSTEEFGLCIDVPRDRTLVEGQQVPVKVSPSKKSYLEIDFDSIPPS